MYLRQDEETVRNLVGGCPCARRDHLTSREKVPVPIKQEAGWAPQPVWTIW